jgi:hypothetical protein
MDTPQEPARKQKRKEKQVNQVKPENGEEQEYENVWEEILASKLKKIRKLFIPNLFK